MRRLNPSQARSCGVMSTSTSPVRRRGVLGRTAALGSFADSCGNTTPKEWQRRRRGDRSRERRVLLNGWFWIGGLAAFFIFLPHFVWLIQHDFPFLELMNNIRRTGRDVVRGPIPFIADQAMILNPVLFPLWFGGGLWLFFGRDGRRYRVLAWTYLTLLVTFIVLRGKNYYLAPAYPMLFAAGGIVVEKLSSRMWKRVRLAYVLAILFFGFALAPLTAPILSVEKYLRYKNLLGLEPMRSENQQTGLLPQYFADEFGWEEMTREVARVYNSLPATPTGSSSTTLGRTSAE